MNFFLFDRSALGENLKMMRHLTTLAIALTCASLAAAANWPNWRGPDNQGHCDEKEVPLEWDRTKNVRWRVSLPDEGNSTPVVWGDRVFVTQAKDKTSWPPEPKTGGIASAETRMLLCFRRADGKLLWESKVTYKDKESTHPTNPFCSASPATDGERVYVSHGSAGLYCYDCHGKQVWHRDTGKQEHIWGNASSPILYGDLCILWVGPGENQVLLAVNKKTGQEVWRHVELGGKSGSGSAREWRGSWSTPIVARVNGRDELILSVPEKVLAFDPQTGKELWSCAGLGPLVYSSPVVSHDGIVVAMSGFHNAALAVRAGGEGDVTQKRLWLHKPQNPQRIGSGVVVGEHLYLLNEPGTASCLDLKTGEDRWNRERVSSSSWSSMVAAGDRLYITNQSGETIVLKTGAKPVVLARNKLGEPVRASIAVSDGDVFVRTHKALWCISEKK